MNAITIVIDGFETQRLIVNVFYIGHLRYVRVCLLKDKYKKLLEGAKKITSKKASSKTFSYPDTCNTPDSTRQKSIPTPNYGKTSEGKHKSKR